eukprot:SAG11_NODE_8409_length_1018_cov_5.899891_1_plen_240_part_01
MVIRHTSAITPRRRRRATRDRAMMQPPPLTGQLQLLALATITLLPLGVTAALVFDSVAHLGSLPGARADANFLLSFFELDEQGTRFVVAKAPNGSVLASSNGGIDWVTQSTTAEIPGGSYAVLPTVYQNLGGWPPTSGLPLAYAGFSQLPETYEPPAPAGFTYTGSLVTLSAEMLPPCVKVPSGSSRAVGAGVNFSLVSHDGSLCAFKANGSRVYYKGHVCDADGSILWDNMSTPYHIPP